MFVEMGLLWVSLVNPLAPLWIRRHQPHDQGGLEGDSIRSALGDVQGEPEKRFHGAAIFLQRETAHSKSGGMLPAESSST